MTREQNKLLRSALADSEASVARILEQCDREEQYAAEDPIRRKAYLLTSEIRHLLSGEGRDDDA